MRRVPSIVSIDITQRLAARAARSAVERATYRPNAARDRRVFRAAAAITVTSHWAAADLMEDLPECAPRVHVMPYPVPLDGFDAGWIEERHRRAETGGAPRFLFLGGDFVRKGGETLLAAWQASGLGGTGATLVIASDYALDPSRLPPGVSHVTGVRAGSAAWLELWRHADAFVMPTRDEAFGMVFQEAAAAGIPAIGTRINAIPEIVRDGVTGVLVTPDDVPCLVAALVDAAASPDRRRTMGTAARRHVEAAGDAAAYRDRLGDILRSVAGRRR
jgi:starch synthase